MYIFREIKIFTSSATGQDFRITKNHEGVSVLKWKLTAQVVFLKKLQLAISVHPLVFCVKFSNVVFFFLQEVISVFVVNFFNN